MIYHIITENMAILLIALIVAAIIGGPYWLHKLLMLDLPARISNHFLISLEKRLNRSKRGDDVLQSRGRIMLWFVILVALITGLIISYIASIGGYIGVAIEVAVVAYLLPIRRLLEQASLVKKSLQLQDITKAATLVSPIARREVAGMDRHCIARASIEYMAENFADHIIAPAMWYALLGLPAMLVCVAVNQMDSLFAHRNKKHAKFGRAIARFDTFIQYVPARLTAIFMIFASLLTPSANPIKAFSAIKDSGKDFASANSGLPIGAMAGAINISLGGARKHHGVLIDDAWVGSGIAKAEASDITKAQFLIGYSYILLIIVIAMLNL